MAEQPEPVPIATIVGPHGVRGWVKLHTQDEQARQLEQSHHWQLRPASGGWQPRPPAATRRSNKRLLAKFDDVDDRDAAELLRGWEVGLERRHLPKLQADEYFWGDLEGLEVLDADKQSLGTVARVLSTPANDVLEIEGSAGAVLIPFKARYIQAVDLQARRILTTWKPDY